MKSMSPSPNPAPEQRQVEHFYDQEAKTYDMTRYESKYGLRKDRFHKALLCDLLDTSSLQDGRVLEVGCGTGRFLCELRSRGINVCGVDISQGMLDKARARLEQHGFDDVPLYRTDSLPFDHGSFAAVYSIFVVNLIPDYRALFQRVAKVVKPGGLFVFNVPNLSSIFLPIGLYVNSRGKTVTWNNTGYRYCHWFWRKEWQRALADAGFTVERVAGQPPWCGRVENCSPLNGRGPGGLISRTVFIKARRLSTETPDMQLQP